MKRVRLHLGVAIMLMTICSVSCYAEEDEGFVKKMFSRFGRKEKVAEPSKTTTVHQHKTDEGVAQVTEGEDPELPERAKDIVAVTKKVGDAEGDAAQLLETEVSGVADYEDMSPEELKEEKEGLIFSVNRNLDVWGEQIAGQFPALVKVEDDEGNGRYKYRRKDGMLVEFEDLDYETVLKLYRLVTNVAVFLRTSRLNAQLRQISEINRMQDQQRAIRASQQIPRIPPTPRTYTPPPTPNTSTPPKTYTPPHIPTLPPATQRR